MKYHFLLLLCFCFRPLLSAADDSGTLSDC